MRCSNIVNNRNSGCGGSEFDNVEMDDKSIESFHENSESSSLHSSGNSGCSSESDNENSHCDDSSSDVEDHDVSNNTNGTNSNMMTLTSTTSDISHENIKIKNIFSTTIYLILKAQCPILLLLLLNRFKMYLPKKLIIFYFYTLQ
jgi:hypothetical protein